MGSGNVNNAGGFGAVLQRSLIVEHTIDDVEANVLKEPAYLSIGSEEVANIRVLMDKEKGGKEIVTLIDYSVLEPAVVYKVYETGTDAGILAKISLWR